eukprot:Hpha_TRINITY_DN13267_c0_g1::TRINITY_DN13267_c0_g1_i1::g.154483::m.154483
MAPLDSIRVGAITMGANEFIKPPYNLDPHYDPNQNSVAARQYFSAAAAAGADLVVFPETFELCGIPYSDYPKYGRGKRFQDTAPRWLRPMCRDYKVACVYGALYEEVAGGETFIRNAAILIDEKGEFVVDRETGQPYCKKHPTDGEIANGIVPGMRTVVLETPRLGKVGFAICFDVNWGEMWNDMKSQGARFVVWISAYPGGLPVQMRAFENRLPIITSVQGTQPAKLIDCSGRVIAGLQSSRWQRLILGELNLTKTLFHTDGQAEKLVKIQNAYGGWNRKRKRAGGVPEEGGDTRSRGTVKVETLDEEHLFTLEIVESDGRESDVLKIEELIEEFGLVTYDEYIRRCTVSQNECRRDRNCPIDNTST